jgi:copper resistance protein C
MRIRFVWWGRHSCLPSFIVVTLLIFASTSFGHAFLDHADPKVGSENSVAPTEIKVWFTEEIEPAFSTLKVLDANGNEIDKKDSHLDPNDKKLLIVSVPRISAGQYKVEWSVVASDTHHTHGDFKFTVKPKD